MSLIEKRIKMLNLSSRGLRKTSAETRSIMAPCLACFSLPLRRNSTVYHNSALSERVIEEDERQKQMMMTSSAIDDHLPDYLLLEIFQRLPLKSVFRAKSVNKRWNLLITDPLFPHSYASHHSSPPFALFYIGFIPETKHPCQIGPYFPPSQHSTFPLNFFTTQLRKLQKEIRSLQLIGCSSDLLLFSSSDNFYVCNPLTFSWFTLQHPPRHCPRYPVVGFMVEPDDGTFWIVQILASGLPSSSLLVFQVYCSTTAKWSANQVTCPGRFDSFAMKTTQVYQGSIVWMVEDGLLWYNPRTALIKVSALPNDRIRRGIIAVSCSRLHYYELSRYDPALRVWMMMMSGEWVVKHVIRHDHFWSGDAVVPETRSYLRWVCSNPTDSDVVFLKCDERLVTCKLSSGCLEVVRCDEKEGVFYRLEWDVMPLVFKPWPTALSKDTTCLV